MLELSSNIRHRMQSAYHVEDQTDRNFVPFQKLGCDLILNSNAKEDQCRVCNGNGGSCKTYKYINNEDGNG